MVRRARGRGHDGLLLLEIVLIVEQRCLHPWEFCVVPRSHYELQNKVPERTGTLLTFNWTNKLRRATLTVQVFVFFVLSLSALFLLIGLPALLSALTSLAGLALLTGLSATLTGLSALLSLLAILFHIVCHQ